MRYHQVNQDIVLSLFEENHAQKLFNAVAANKEYLSKWMSFPDAIKNIEDTKTFIQKSLFQFVNREGFWTGIWYKENLVGSIGFLYFDWKVMKTEIGYWLEEAYTNKGIMTSACRAMTEYAFADLKLNKVEIKTAADNIKSAAIPKRLGFKQEGTIRADEIIRDTFHDRVVYGMLRSEWNRGGKES